MKIGHILAIVAVGVACSFFAHGRFTDIVGPVTLYVFLPPLLFEAAWNLDYRAVRRQWRAIGTLAFPGVVLTAAIVAGALLLLHVPLDAALLTGAILSATDPIAVVAVFRHLRVPKTLATLVECESLFNDAVAVLLYRAVLVVIAVGPQLRSIGFVAIGSLVGAAGAIVLGVGVGFIVARVLRGLGNAYVQIGASALCAYGVYFVADYVGASGLFATIAFGIALRYFERNWIAFVVADGVDRAWRVAAFLANAVVFFLVGASFVGGEVVREPVFVVTCIVAAALARFAVAELLRPAAFPSAWLSVVRVAGLRGGLSLALALALPLSLPFRTAIVDGTFGVVLVSILVGGVAIAPLAKQAARRPGSRATPVRGGG